MPVCWITGCKFTPGRLHNGHEIKLHCFPNSLERIKEWLLQLGQDFHDIDNIAKQVLDSKLKKSNKFRFCSLHFSDDSFIINAGGRTLRPNAIPTIFESVPHSSEKIHETLSLRKTYKRKRKEKPSEETSLMVPSENPSPLIPPQSIKTEEPDDFPSHNTSTESTIENCDIIKTIVKTESYRDAETQTDFTYENSIIHLPGTNLMMGNPAVAPCSQPYLALQNPIVVLNCCFVNNPGSPS